MPHGWVGNLLRVDVTKQTVDVESSEPYTEAFLGGKGINAKVLWDEVSPAIKPFDPANRLIVGTGPLTGTLAPSACRCSITAKSPITGKYGDTNLGGFWPAALKFAGYDQVVISGCCSRPVYLFIHNGAAELRGAAHLWGKDTCETTAILQEELSQEAGCGDVPVLCIGPAGENKVASAALTVWPANSGSRTGMGAVMGAKNLKAIVVSGTRDISIARPQELMMLSERLVEGMKPLKDSISNPWERVHAVHDLTLYGTCEETPPKDAPSQETLVNTIREFCAAFSRKTPSFCLNCHTPCRSFFEFSETAEKTILHCDTWQIYSTRVKDTEIDFLTDSRLFMKCQKLGIDVFSVVADVAFLLDLYERGIVDQADLDGLPLKWGDKEILEHLIDKISKREGCGELFARGIAEAAKRIGRGAEEHAFHTKGLELINYSPYLIDVALGAAVSQRADQVRAHSGALLAFSSAPPPLLQMLTAQLPRDVAETVTEEGYVGRYEGKARLVEYFERSNSLADILGLCRWWAGVALLSGIMSPGILAQLVSQVTGKDLSDKALDRYNERVETLIRAFNVREGLTRNDDTIPSSYFTKVSSRYGYKLDRDRFDDLLTKYYTLRGWGEDGMPRKDRLSALGLDYVAEDLEKRGLI